MYHSRFSGTHYEAGFKYGSLLYKNGKYLNYMHTLNLNDEKRDFCRKSLKIYEKEYPEILEEIKGIADGQKMPFEDLATFLLPMYSYTFNNYCTCFACKKGEQVIFGRNSDFVVSLEKFYESCFYSLEGYNSFIGNTTAMVQMEDGINEYGLAIGLTFVWPTVKKPGINAGLMVRYVLEKCKNVDEALEALKNFTVASSQTLTMADRSGKMSVVECNAEKFVVIEPKNGENFVAAVNEFNSPKMVKYRCDLDDEMNSHLRYEVACNALENNKDYSLQYAKDLLSGEFGFMCQYDRSKGADTVWSSVYMLNENKVYRCEGNPSRKKYKEDTRLKFND